MSATPNPTDEVLDAALAYAGRGWRVIPIKPGGKHPAGIEQWQNNASDDPELIRSWFTGLYRGYGVGIVTGAASGLFVLDVDDGVGKDGPESLADLEATYGRLPETFEVLTGSGGRHLYFAWPDGVEIRNDQAGRLGIGLDIRGEGGQVLAPPTVHPNGRHYEQEVSSPDELAPAPAWLLRLLTKDDGQDKPRRFRATSLEVTGNRPGDRFGQQVTWPQLLESIGATYIGSRIERETGERYELWSRPPLPGEKFVPHTGATLYYKGSDILKVFTSNWRGVDTSTGELTYELVQGDTYTRFGFYATVWHGGDYVQAAEAARRQFPDPEDDTDTGKALEAPEPPEPEPVVSDDIHADWPDPRPLVDLNLPPFPVDALPDWVQEWCHDTAEAVQTPIDLPAMCALGVLSALATGKVEVEVRSGWVERANLYLAIGMPPSSGKSPVFGRAFDPLEDYQDELRAKAGHEIATWRAKRSVLDKTFKEAERVGNIPEMIAAEIELRGVDAEEPYTPQLLADDQTPEAFVELLHQQRRIAIVSTEGGLFNGLDRYTDGKAAQLDPYLKAWSGDLITVNRKSLKEPLIIKGSLASICLTVQPGVLAEMGTRRDFTIRGLPHRFMYSVPESLVGSRHYVGARGVDPVVQDRWATTVLDAARRLEAFERPVRLQLDPRARLMFERWQESLERRRGDGGDLADMAEWTTKCESSVIRAAALMWVAEGGHGGPTVSVDMMSRALALGVYWLGHAKAVSGIWKPQDRVSDAQEILRLIRERGWRTFNPRDVMRAHSRRFPRREAVDDALDLLEEKDWVRTLPSKRHDSRPTVAHLSLTVDDSSSPPKAVMTWENPETPSDCQKKSSVVKYTETFNNSLSDPSLGDPPVSTPRSADSLTVGPDRPDLFAK